ncbi:MAG: hypothetical protein AAF403_02790, partial [Pseudomonadota bacterium]
RILKPGGHLVCLIPDEDLYEQGDFPSNKNTDHKVTFTIFKSNSWSSKSISLVDFIPKALADAQIIKMELLDKTYRYDLPKFDQTMTPIGESAIEFVLRKPTMQEITDRGRLPQNKKDVGLKAFQELTFFRATVKPGPDGKKRVYIMPNHSFPAE